MTIGERLKKLRKTLGLTQQEFSGKLKVSRSNIATYEVGKNNPAEAVINLICREFNVNKDWLRTGKGEMFVETPHDTLDALAQEYHLDRFGRAVVEKMLSLNEKQWAVFRDFATDVLESLSEKTDTPDTSGQEQTQPDLAAKVAELERQNQELAAKIAAMEEEDVANGLWDESSASPSASVSISNPERKV